MAFFWVSSATAASPSAAFDAIELNSVSGVIRVHRACLWQTTDLGDAAEEVLRTEWVRGNATSGSGGQTSVITPLNPFDASTSGLFTAEMLNTTVASTGTPVAMGVMGWNIRIPLDVLYPPEQTIIARTTERLCFRVSAPADAITCNASFLVEQI